MDNENEVTLVANILVLNNLDNSELESVLQILQERKIFVSGYVDVIMACRGIEFSNKVQIINSRIYDVLEDNENGSINGDISYEL